MVTISLDNILERLQRTIAPTLLCECQTFSTAIHVGALPAVCLTNETVFCGVHVSHSNVALVVHTVAAALRESSAIAPGQSLHISSGCAIGNTDHHLQ